MSHDIYKCHMIFIIACDIYKYLGDIYKYIVSDIYKYTTTYYINTQIKVIFDTNGTPYFPVYTE